MEREGGKGEEEDREGVKREEGLGRGHRFRAIGPFSKPEMATSRFRSLGGVLHK